MYIKNRNIIKFCFINILYYIFLAVPGGYSVPQNTSLDTIPIITSPTVVSTTPRNVNQVTIANQVASVPKITIVPSTSKTKVKQISNPTIVSANKNKNLTSSNFNTVSTAADLKLPAEIFASDDSVSDVALNDENLQNILQDNFLSGLVTAPVATTQDKMVGGINLKIERPDKTHSKKSKSKSNKKPLENLSIPEIKTEVQDDNDWNNMTLATVNNSNPMNRLQTM